MLLKDACNEFMKKFDSIKAEAVQNLKKCENMQARVSE